MTGQPPNPCACSNRVIPPYLFPRKFSKRSRLTYSCPDAVPITPCKTKPTPPSPSTSCSHTIMRYAADTTHTEDHNSQLREATPSTECRPAACALD
eukprot:525356-Pelagomonas_calceolata.AAC.1